MVERTPDKGEVGGSNPPARRFQFKRKRGSIILVLLEQSYINRRSLKRRGIVEVLTDRGVSSFFVLAFALLGQDDKRYNKQAGGRLFLH